MKILVIHDRAEVGAQIVDLCEQIVGSTSSVELVGDYVSATNALRQRLYDLAIVDLTLPHISARGTPNYETAHNLLDEIFQTDHLHSPGDIVGITRDESALKFLSGDIGHHLMAVIAETSDGAWKRQLEDRIKYCIRSASARQRSYRSQFDTSICVVSALDEEMAPFLKLVEVSPDRRMPNASNFIFQCVDGHTQQGIVYSIGRAGIARAAIRVQELLSTFRPQVLLMIGFCGGVEGKVQLGDIALFENVFDWDCGKWSSNADESVEFLARPEPISIRDSEVHQVLREFVQDGLPDVKEEILRAKTLSPDFDGEARVRLVSAGSGSSVVADESVIQRIRGLSDAISAVDMESYGLYLAAHATYLKRPSAFCIKSVADYCDGNKHDGLHAACCYLSARAAFHLITQRLHFRAT